MEVNSFVLARKPLSESSVASNVLKWGTGGLNIDVSRISYEKGYVNTGRFPANLILGCNCNEILEGKQIKGNENYKWNNTTGSGDIFTQRGKYTPRTETPMIHTNPECPCYIMDSKSGNLKSGKMLPTHTRHTNESPNGIYNKFDINHPLGETYGDSGGASRFFKIIK